MVEKKKDGFKEKGYRTIYIGDFKPPMEERIKDRGKKEVKWLKLIRRENLRSQDCLDMESFWEEV